MNCARICHAPFSVLLYCCFRACLLSHVKFKSLVMLKSLRALTDPGEAVGLLAAQVNWTVRLLSVMHVDLTEGEVVNDDGRSGFSMEHGCAA